MSLGELSEYGAQAAAGVAAVTGHDVTCICPRCFKLYIAEMARLRRTRRAK